VTVSVTIAGSLGVGGRWVGVGRVAPDAGGDGGVGR
jgi:hypothetical protein